MSRDLHWRRLAREAGAAHARADSYAAESVRAAFRGGFGEGTRSADLTYREIQHRRTAIARDAEARASYTALLGRSP